MERGCTGIMIRKRILIAREYSKKVLLKEEKQKQPSRNQRFYISFYPVFQNIRNVLQELHLLLASEKENKVFLNAPVVGFRNGKSLKDYQVRAVLTKTNETEICESRGKKTCLFYNSIRTTTTLITKTCGETFIIRSGPLNCNSEKVLYLLK